MIETVASEPCVDEDSSLIVEKINSVNTAKGGFVFDAPEVVSADLLIFESELFSDPIEIWLR